VEFTPADIADGPSLTGLLEGVHIVVNLAGQLGGPGVTEEDYRRANVDGPRLLMEAAAGAGIERFIHVSTVGVLGDTGRTPASEEAPANPSGGYETTKWEGECAVRDAGRRNGIPVTVVRPALVYGPRDLHLLPMFRAARKPWFFLIDGGRTLTHPVHRDDVVESLIICACSETARTGVYHIAGERPVSFKELFRALASVSGGSPPRLSLPYPAVRSVARMLETAARPFGVTPPLTMDRLRIMTTNRAYDIGRAKSELGWAPRIELEAGLRDTVTWYRDHGLL
jgi:nucleoside-diphosphate-sugar epimerase